MPGRIDISEAEGRDVDEREIEQVHRTHGRLLVETAESHSRSAGKAKGEKNGHSKMTCQHDEIGEAQSQRIDRSRLEGPLRQADHAEVQPQGRKKQYNTYDYRNRYGPGSA